MGFALFAFSQLDEIPRDRVGENPTRGSQFPDLVAGLGIESCFTCFDLFITYPHRLRTFSSSICQLFPPHFYHSWCWGFNFALLFRSPRRRIPKFAHHWVAMSQTIPPIDWESSPRSHTVLFWSQKSPCSLVIKLRIEFLGGRRLARRPQLQRPILLDMIFLELDLDRGEHLLSPYMVSVGSRGRVSLQLFAH